MFIRCKTVRAKVIALTVAAAVLPSAALLCTIAWEKTKVRKEIDVELDKMVRADLGGVAQDVYAMCQAQNEFLMQSLDGNMRVAKEILKSAGGVALSGETVSWNAVNQLNQAASTVNLPKMTIGGAWTGQIREAGRTAPLVDQVTDLVGGTCTVFQRMNPQGDMIRVATNVVGKDQSRAIGTYVPATNPDGSANPVVAAVTRGSSYRGRAFVVDKWYMAVYEPLRDASGDVIGMLYVGIPQENVASLRQAISTRTLGETGYVYVLGGTGAHRGRYIISKDGARDGEDLWESKDADGKPFIQSMVNSALNVQGNGVAFERYAWKNQGESKARTKLAAVTYFEPWDWVIGAGAYEDEFRAANIKAASALMLLFWISAAIGLFASAVIVLIGISLVSRVIARPIGRLSEVADSLARGEVDVQIDAAAEDEIGALSRSMATMVENTREQAETMRRIGEGDLEAEVRIRSDRDVLAKSMTETIGTLRNLTNEVGELSRAAVAGDLSRRGQASAFHGGYREIVEGVNETLAAMVNPIQ
ncbi:MAG: Cache 3/Cache 2 fusion domain-containing protein, partial [Candidatus Eisenbacteria bacterium]|nr:Cache 3/Cache 2 fusion domain-containing protein [Candidatus Eisenbacteria bacterium]